MHIGLCTFVVELITHHSGTHSDGWCFIIASDLVRNYGGDGYQASSFINYDGNNLISCPGY
jgi:hypothetical protein